MFEKFFGKSPENSHNEPKNVHCEITGNETTLENTVVLVKIDAVIALKNLSNPLIDFDNKIIKPIDKPPLKFYSELVVPSDLKGIFGRIFSIINDKDEIEISTAIMSQEGQKVYSGRNLIPFIEHINNGIELLNLPKTMFFAVIDTISPTNTKTCENWKINYKGLGPKYRFKGIINEKTEKQTFGFPSILFPGFDVAVSDCAQKNPNGT